MVTSTEGFPHAEVFNHYRNRTVESYTGGDLCVLVYQRQCIEVNAATDGTRPFTVSARSPWGRMTSAASPQRGLLNDILIDLRVAASHDRLKANTWLNAGGIKVHDTRHTRR